MLYNLLSFFVIYFQPVLHVKHNVQIIPYAVFKRLMQQK